MPNDPNSDQPSENPVAVVFADVAGSSRLYEALGNAAALAAINQSLGDIRAACEGHLGRVIKTIGDEAMTVFPHIDLAAEAARGMQRRVARRPAVGSLHLALRIGMHFGLAIHADGDVFGDSVNVAARMVAMAKAGQILLPKSSAAVLAPWLAEHTREIDSLTIRGKVHDVIVCELLWDESEEDRTMLAERQTISPARLHLQYGEQLETLGPESSVLTLGREPQSDIVIIDKLASRVHARIERRRDKYVLIDLSTNGTYITFAGETEITLRREEIVLRGLGKISFGHACATNPDDTVTFACEG